MIKLTFPPYAQTHYLGFHLSKQETGENKGKLTPYAQALMDAFTAGRGLRWMYEESDKLAQDPVKGADPKAESPSVYAGRIAGLLLHQAEQLYPNLVEAKGPDAQTARLLGSHSMIPESFLIRAIQRVAEREGQDPNQAAEAFVAGVEARNKTGTFAEGERFSYHIGGDPTNPDITIWYGDQELRLTVADLREIYGRGQYQAFNTVAANRHVIEAALRETMPDWKDEFESVSDPQALRQTDAMARERKEAEDFLLWDRYEHVSKDL